MNIPFKLKKSNLDYHIESKSHIVKQTKKKIMNFVSVLSALFVKNIKRRKRKNTHSYRKFEMLTESTVRKTNITFLPVKT